MAPYAEARGGLLVFAAVLLVIVAAAAGWFSGTIARPLRVLTDAAQRMISGNYDIKVGVYTDDDFGTGHSSLAQIKNMPLHELKIGKSFLMTLMTDEQNEAIVRTTIELAHNMNLQVVAEGIEDEQTLRQISDMGCEEAQGYFLSKPVSSDDLLDWLNNREVISCAERRRPKRAFAKKA